MEPKESVTLCPECGMCPEVKIFENHVTIGEEGNMVRLKVEGWDTLVEKTSNGELKKL